MTKQYYHYGLHSKNQYDPVINLYARRKRLMNNFDRAVFSLQYEIKFFRDVHIFEFRITCI